MNKQNHNNNENIFWFDTETGGFNPRINPCLSVGYVITNKNLDIVFKNELLIKNTYDLKCTSRALEVNKINLEEHNKVALEPKEVIRIIDRDIKKFFGKRKPFLGGHNIVKFDIPFMEALYDRENEVFETSYKNLDTLHIVRALILLGVINLESASMNMLVPYFNLPSGEKQHSALFDALNCVYLMRILKKLRLLKLNKSIEELTELVQK